MLYIFKRAVSSVPLSQGRDSETLRDSGTVQMSHSSVTGVRSKSFIWWWISDKYSLEKHLAKSCFLYIQHLSEIYELHAR